MSLDVKKSTPQRLLRIAGVVFVVMVLLKTCTTEYQGKLALRSYAKTGASLTEFRKEYGEPRYTYRSWESLPEEYQQLLGGPSQTEDTYYAYQMEGLPTYWSFVVSVDSETQTVQRYIYWRAIALRPRENIQPVE